MKSEEGQRLINKVLLCSSANPVIVWPLEEIYFMSISIIKAGARDFMFIVFYCWHKNLDIIIII